MAHFHSQFGGDEQDIAPSRQLISLLPALDSPAPAILANVLTTIRAAQLIAAVTAAAAAAANNDSRSGAEAAQAIHKLGVRINGLLSRSRDRHAQRAGFELAREWAEQGGWQVIAAHAQPWLATGLSALQSTNEIDRLVLHPILALLGEQLLGQQAAARPEYNRQVVTPNVAKFGTALIACAEKEVEQGGRVDVLNALFATLSNQLLLHSTPFRPLAPRIHALCTRVLFAESRSEAGVPVHGPPPSLLESATRLLSTLHVTGAPSAPGKGREEMNGANRASAPQLWAATVGAVLGSAREAWEACTSSWERNRSSEGAADLNARLDLAPLPSDPLTSIPIALARLERLLGGPMGGVLGIFLRTPTPRPVPLPIGVIFSLLGDILCVTRHTPAAANVDTAQRALELSILPQLHLLALPILAQVALTAPAGAAVHLAPLLPRLAFLLEDAQSNRHALVRQAILRTIGLLFLPAASGGSAGIALDPAARITLRLSKAVLAEVARFASAPAPEQSARDNNGNSAGASAGGAGRKAKKQRLYESDAVFAPAGGSGWESKSVEESQAAKAAVECLPAFFPHFSTALTGTHHDLAHLSVLLLLALLSQLLRGGSTHASTAARAELHQKLACSALVTLGQILALLDGPLLGLAAPRAREILADAALSNSAQIRATAYTASLQLSTILHPRLPPLLQTRAAIERPPPEDALTGAPMLDEVRGTSVGTHAGTLLGLGLVPNLSAPTRTDQNNGSLAPSTSADENTTYPSTASSSLAREPSQSSPPTRKRSSTNANLSGFSPDPIKPRRAATPRIGSPSVASASQSRSTSVSPSRESGGLSGSNGGGGVGAGAAGQAGAKAVQTLFGRAGASEREDGDSELDSSSVSRGRERTSAAWRASLVDVVTATTTTTTTNSSTGTPTPSASVSANANLADGPAHQSTSVPSVARAGGDDDDDEAMPEIDLGRSDDEEESEESEESEQ